MKKLLILILLLGGALYAQDFSFWNNIRNSAFTEDNNIHIRCETIDLPQIQTEIYYSLDGVWETIDMTNLSGLTYEAVIPGNPNETLQCRFKTESDTLVGMMPAFIADDPSIPEIEEMSFIKDDPAGDILEGDENLDITSQYFGYSDNRIYAAVSNESGSFPTDSGGLFPDAYYFYIYSLTNPETVISDSVVYAMVYANIPFLFSPGLYKFNAASMDLDSIEQIGDISTSTSDGSLILSCNFEDLANDPDFGDWPNELNSLLAVPLTNTFNLSGEFGIADFGTFSVQNFTQYIVEPANNVLPEISEIEFAVANGSTIVFCTYFDANGNFPLTAEVDTIHEQSDNDWTYQLFPQSLDFSEPVIFTATFEDDNWDELLFRFSDNNFDTVFAEITTDADEEQLQITNYKLQNYPNPFNPETTISFDISCEDAKDTKLEIYNVKGQKVESIPIYSFTHSPINSVIWNADKFSSGVYFYKLVNDNKTLVTKKMLLMK